jgi:hypothetical protein
MHWKPGQQGANGLQNGGLVQLGASIGASTPASMNAEMQIHPALPPLVQVYPGQHEANGLQFCGLVQLGPSFPPPLPLPPPLPPVPPGWQTRDEPLSTQL